MTAASDASLLLQSTLACSFYNVDSSHAPRASLDKRSEGWTEVWGTSNIDTSGGDVPDTTVTTSPPALTLIQYRPAWLEQMALSMAGVPHVVLNSPYLATESTGPLPCLQQQQQHVGTTSNAPILVGRRQAGFHQNNKNCILDYLTTTTGSLKIDLDDSIKDNAELQQKSILYTTLLETKLEPILVYMQFQDYNTWYDSQRRMCVAASNSNFMSGRFQAWCERIVALKELGKRRFASVDEAVESAHQSYGVLEHALNGNQQYLLGQAQPTLADAVLWAHLADALVHPHLAKVLQEYPNLAAYHDRIHQEYLVPPSTDTRKEPTHPNDYKSWNYEQNLQNAFYQWPSRVSEVVAQQQATRESSFYSTWHRWRMGGGWQQDAVPKGSDSDDPNPEVKKMIQQSRRNDEQWISVVIGTAALAIAIVIGSVSSSPPQGGG